MRAHPHIPTYSVAFHFRISSFFTPFILLLVGIPCLIGFEESIQSRFVGVLISIAVSAGFYTLLFVFNSIGESGTVPPVLAGWLPVVVIGSLGLYLFESRLS
jgi:lipopolysaccharide export LptBFGC system permease protein LptF